MKPGVGIYQAVTQVKVLSPVIFNVKEVDSFHELEDRMICVVKVRDRLLLRGLSPRHDRGRKRQELGRPCMLRAIAEKEETAACDREHTFQLLQW